MNLDYSLQIELLERDIKALESARDQLHRKWLGAFHPPSKRLWSAAGKKVQELITEKEGIVKELKALANETV